MKWHPLTEAPSPIDESHSAIILCVCEEEAHYLFPTLAVWDVMFCLWKDEVTEEAIFFHEGDDYYWAYEIDIIAEAISKITEGKPA